MASASTRLRRDERGISNMLVGFGFIGFMAATVLALDVGWWVVARSQAQNSADAGALAGAVALVFNDFNNRAPSGPAVTSAINAAEANGVGNGQVDVGPEDVTFPLGPTGLNNRVGVLVERPIPTILGVDVRHDDDAEPSLRGSRSVAGECRAVSAAVHPSRQVAGSDRSAVGDGLVLRNVRQAGEPAESARQSIRPGVDGTGYKAADKGTLIELKTGNGSKVSPSVYNPWAIPGSTGADDYEDAIAGCKTGHDADGLAHHARARQR